MEGMFWRLRLFDFMRYEIQFLRSNGGLGEWLMNLKMFNWHIHMEIRTGTPQM
jgi:hypothetical protein